MVGTDLEKLCRCCAAGDLPVTCLTALVTGWSPALNVLLLPCAELIWAVMCCAVQCCFVMCYTIACCVIL